VARLVADALANALKKLLTDRNARTVCHAEIQVAGCKARVEIVPANQPATKPATDGVDGVSRPRPVSGRHEPSPA
jgi:hypothetical protein